MEDRIWMALIVDKPEEIKFELRTVMDLEDWQLLADQLKEGKNWTAFPAFRFIQKIDEMTKQAKQVFEGPEEKEE